MQFQQLPKLTALLLCAVASFPSSGQSPVEAIVSPNAASLGSFNQVHASPFTGVPEISVPLFSKADGEVEFNMSLQYNTSLVKPDLYPGTTGLGWSLFAGGSISRIPNGPNLYDENVTTLDETRSFRYRNQMLAGAWATPAHIVNNLGNMLNDENDFEPDEFSFNFGQYSGSFFLNYDDTWQVRSRTPVQIKVIEHMRSLTSGFFNNFYTMDQLYTGFTLITPDGTQYLFGHLPSEWTDSTWDPTAIEFSANATRGMSQDQARESLIPMTWHLRRITSPGGREVNFDYERKLDPQALKDDALHTVTRTIMSEAESIGVELPDGCAEECFDSFPGNVWPLFPLNIVLNLILNGELFCDCVAFTSISSSWADLKVVTLVYPSYPKKITFDDNSYIDFQFGASAQLEVDTPLELQLAKPEFAMGPEHSTRRKLDRIFIKTSDNRLMKEVEFNYTESPTTRLFLSSVHIIGRAGTREKYEFEYDQTYALPAYNSGQIDHWGYFIGGPGYFTQGANIVETREVTTQNSDYMRAGLLVKVKYPTSGHTVLVYEPHKFSAIVTRSPIGVTTGDETLTGGMRIWKMISKDENNVVLNEKEFLYVKNFQSGGSTSSGVLGTEPNYTEMWKFSGEVQFMTFSDRLVLPLSLTNGSHVTYSEVVERETGSNGYKITKYTNSDNSLYRDQEPFLLGMIDPTSQRTQPFNSLAETRGNVVSEAYYNQANKLQREIAYEYNTTLPGAYDAKTNRAVFCKRFFRQIPPNVGVAFDAVASYGNYVFCPYLKKRTETNYDALGQNPSTNYMEYTYTSNDQVSSEKMKANTGLEFITTYKYPLDFTSPVLGEGDVTRLKDLHIVAPVMEEVRYKASAPAKVLAATRRQYREFSAGVVEPWRTYSLPIVTPPDYSTFDISPQVVDSESVQVSVDDCCNLTHTSTTFNMPVATGQQEVSTVLTLHMENPSVAHGWFTYTLTGPTGDQIFSYTLLGTTVGSVYSIDLSKSYNLVPGGDYTITLSYTYSAGFGGSSFYGTAHLAATVTEGFTGMELREEFKFNSDANPVSYNKFNDAIESYLWSPDHSLVARISNAADNEILFVDFEDQLSDNTPPHTGHHAKAGDYSVAFVPPNSKEYKVSYWYSDSGVWKFSGLLSYAGPSMLLALGDAIDDVRIHPADAQMSTYTHDQLVGVTSITDANNKTSYFEYDEFNRLVTVRDYGRSVQRSYVYHLKTQN